MSVVDLKLTEPLDIEEGLRTPNVIGTVKWDAVPEATFTLELTPDGRLVEFSARATDETTLTARGLRKAPLGEMERAVRSAAHTLASVWSYLGHEHASVDASVDPTSEEADLARSAAALALVAGRMAEDFAQRPRTGVVGRGDAHYAGVAAMYVQLLDAGEPRPVVVVADRLHLSVQTVRNLLFKARERGLLTSAGRGKAGGQLTDKAKEILSGNDQAS